MFMAEPLISAPTRVAEGGEMRSSYFQYKPPLLCRILGECELCPARQSYGVTKSAKL